MAVELSQQVTQNSFAKNSEVMSGSIDKILLHELQLGEKLNHSIGETRRADFSLMLAMLTEDVREQSQFNLPKTTVPALTEPSNSALRKQFDLPEPAPLALTSIESIEQFNQAKIIADKHIATIQLAQAMMPKPLAFRDNAAHIATDVLQNTGIHCQLKHKQSVLAQAYNIENTTSTSTLATDNAANDEDKLINQPLEFNATAWLEALDKSLLSKKLVS